VLMGAYSVASLPVLDYELRNQVCHGTVSLADAQQQIAVDWLAVAR
jgi:hypothetical protein